MKVLHFLSSFHIDSCPAWDDGRCNCGAQRIPLVSLEAAQELQARITQLEAQIEAAPQALAFPHNKDFSETKCPHCDTKFYVAREANMQAVENAR